jgi:PKD repeat protein
MVCCALAAGLATPVLDAATASALRKKADLTVTAVKAPARAMPGARISVSATVRNGGRAKAGKSTTAWLLSRDQKLGRDVVLKPTRPTPALKPRKTWKGSATLTVPAATAAGTYYVLACADQARRVKETQEGNNCRPSGRLTLRLPASSHQLIDEDVATGKLTPEQGLIYKVFSDYGDKRLPSQYIGRGNGLDEGALEEAAETWDDLTSSGQQTLRPFLIPPFYAGSHWSPGVFGEAAEPRPTAAAFDSPWCSGGDEVNPLYESWEHLDTAGGDYRIWWLKKNTGDATQAAHIRDVIDQTILPALTLLMGHGPKRDGNGLCDGGTDATDIALVDASTATVFGDSTCGPVGTSTHMIWPRTKPAAWAGSDPYLAHEIMHTIQFAMPQNGSCGEYKWLREMTAQWVQDYVTDPAYGIGLGPDDTEFQAAKIYLGKPGVSLDVEAPPANHDYGDYLLALWAARRGGPSFVPDIWANAATMKPKQAINAALPGSGFEDSWADFALSNWNQGPVDDYKNWDGLQTGASLTDTGSVPLNAPQTPTIKVNHLAAEYFSLGVDPKATELEVLNDLAGDSHAQLRAIVEYSDGSHKVIDLSTKAKAVICIEDGNKRATSVVLVFSNAHMTDAKTFTPTVTATDQCGCPNATDRPTGDRPAGSVAAPAPADPVCEGTGNITFTWSDHYVSDDWNVEKDGTGSMNLTLVPDPDDPETYVNDPSSTYTVSEVTHSEFYRHHPEGCGDETADITEEGSGALPEEALLGSIYEDTGELWIPRLISLPTVWKFHNEVACIGPQDDEMESVLLPPICPYADGGLSFYEFAPVTPGANTYSFSCDDTHEYVDSMDRHHVVKATVSGTITLPE